MRHESCGPIYFQSKDMHAFVCFISNQLQSNLTLIVCKHAITPMPAPAHQVELAQLSLSWPTSRQKTTFWNSGIRNQGQIKISSEKT